MRDVVPSTPRLSPLLKKKLVRRSLSVTILGSLLVFYVNMLQETEKYGWMKRMTFRAPLPRKRARNPLPVGGTPKNHDDYDDIHDDRGGHGRWDDGDTNNGRNHMALGELRFDVERTPREEKEVEEHPPMPEFPPPPNVSPPPVTEEMERKFHSQIRVRVDKMSFPNAPDALIDVVNRMGLYRGSVVVVSFANSHHIDLAVNFILWALSLIHI